jgi:hypothetical protein
MKTLLLLILLSLVWTVVGVQLDKLTQDFWMSFFGGLAAGLAAVLAVSWMIDPIEGRY